MNDHFELPGENMRGDNANESLLTRESWKIFQIMAEFVEGYERLSRIRPSVSVFGSARTPLDHPNYKLAEAIGYELSCAGFSVVTGGGPGVMEAAILTLLQTGKSRRIPIILVSRAYWNGLLEWFRERLAAEKMIEADDIGLLSFAEQAGEVVELIFEHYGGRGFGPSPEEREKMLDL
jgi:predicted Rossmann-fold nucleotide-binding protein